MLPGKENVTGNAASMELCDATDKWQPADSTTTGPSSSSQAAALETLPSSSPDSANGYEAAYHEQVVLRLSRPPLAMLLYRHIDEIWRSDLYHAPISFFFGIVQKKAYDQLLGRFKALRA